MLLIIELLFLVAGLWSIASSKLPVGLFKFLFGRGDYRLPSTQARLFGGLLASPLPLAFLVSSLLTALLGSDGKYLSIGFELVYILVVIIASVIIARRVRQPEVPPPTRSSSANPEPPSTSRSYGMRLLIISGIVVLSCITFGSLSSLVVVALSTIMVGTRWTGDFWQDEFPIILMVAIIGLGSFGIYKLIRTLRK
jgi:hypothetical protein